MMARTSKKLRPPPLRRTWTLLIAASLYFGVVTRGDAQAIAELTPKAVPAMLVAVQLALLALLALTLRKDLAACTRATCLQPSYTFSGLAFQGISV